MEHDEYGRFSYIGDGDHACSENQWTAIIVGQGARLPAAASLGRLWPWFRRFGRPDRFRFRVTTNRETYTLELKRELPEVAYQLAWSKVYNFERSNR